VKPGRAHAGRATEGRRARLSAALFAVATASAGFACRPPSTTPQTAVAAPATHDAHARFLPARLRRLTNVEYEQTMSALLGRPVSVADRLPPEVRQEGYTSNGAQTVPSAWAARADAIGREEARRAVAERLDRIAPCATAAGDAKGTSATATDDAKGGDAAARCEERWIASIALRAWRRPPNAEEISRLHAVFDAAAGGALDGRRFAAGVEAVLDLLLQSPSLLYLTELGDGGSPGDVVTLGNYEIASILSYTVQGGPPDEELLEAAARGALLSPDVREAQARRLLARSETRMHFRRFVLEWLEVDGLASTVKDADRYPDYDHLKSRMLDETSAFADEAMVYGGGSLRALLDAGFASVDPSMARFYGLKTWGPRASLAGTRRAGVLQQASFLAAHAHEDGTSPVKRGDFVLRKVLCVRIPRPAEVGIDTVFPPPEKTKTTRDRFAAHVADTACSRCHERIDPLGFTFERFDAEGGDRTTENGHDIRTAGQAEVGGQNRAFADSLELSRWLARSPDAAQCYLRQAYRYFTSQSEPAIEDELLALASAAPPELRDNLFEALIAYVRSDLFVRREVRP
jgi:hypothetical protein